MIGLLLALPSRSWASSPLCELGTSIIEQMNLQVNANGKISPAVLTGSIAFVNECPASVMPAFKRFANDEQQLHESWIEALKSGTERSTGSELRGFLAMARDSVERSGNISLKKFLDSVLSSVRKCSFERDGTFGIDSPAFPRNGCYSLCSACQHLGQGQQQL
jgi:hypothetical protein